jgi:hypothetical protein
MIGRKQWVCVLFMIGVAVSTVCAAIGQTKKKPAPQKPTPKNESKGQGQLAGGNGQFGVVYTLSDKLNFAILSAKYTLEPFNAYALTYPATDEKLLVLDLAVKNASTSDYFLNTDSFFTLVDAQGGLIPGGALALKSKGVAEASFNLRPGQGLGQPELKDPLQIAFKVPAKSRIVKIMLNKARLGKQEEVLRYFVAGATKAEAGEVGDPRNTIVPLNETVRDPKDPSGAIPLAEGKGVAGVFVPSGPYAIRLDRFTFSTDKFRDNDPEEGKKFAIATVTVKNLSDRDQTFFDLSGGDTPLHQIIDSSGDRTKPYAYAKAKIDDDAGHEFNPGDEYSFRIVFAMPKAETVKRLILGAGNYRQWAYDGATLK